MLAHKYHEHFDYSRQAIASASSRLAEEHRATTGSDRSYLLVAAAAKRGRTGAGVRSYRFVFASLPRVRSDPPPFIVRAVLAAGYLFASCAVRSFVVKAAGSAQVTLVLKATSGVLAVLKATSFVAPCPRFSLSAGRPPR